jgi:flagellar biosynthesis/type III secretory pathway protein FliH
MNNLSDKPTDMGDLLKAVADASHSAYLTGYEIGFQNGRREAFKEAQALVKKAFEEKP